MGICLMLSQSLILSDGYRDRHERTIIGVFSFNDDGGRVMAGKYLFTHSRIDGSLSS